MEYFVPSNPYFICGVAVVVVVMVINLLVVLFWKFVYWLGLKKVAHYFVAMHAGYDIWLVDKCPYKTGERCWAWTCPAYDRDHQYLCKCCSSDNEVM